MSTATYPQPHRSNTGLVTGIGFGILGLFLFAFGVAGFTASGPATSVPPPVVNVYLPTVAPTATATATATRRPTAIPTVDPLSRFDVCGTATPDALCVVPAPPVPTNTPYPSCAPGVETPTPRAGNLCRWSG